MGIDIYVHEIYDSHNAKHKKAFEHACYKRDTARGKAEKDRLQEKVHALYDKLYEVGYLREAYHGGPYVTRYLVREAFEQGDVAIPAATLRERLPAAVLMAIYRDHIVYGEAASPPGEITLEKDSDVEAQLPKLLGHIFAPGGEIDQVRSGSNEDAMVARIAPEQREQAAQLIAKGKVPDCARQFVEFVEQCEAQEAKTGKPCVVTASY